MTKRKHPAWPVTIVILSGFWAVETPLVFALNLETSQFLWWNVLISAIMIRDAWVNQTKPEADVLVLRKKNIHIDSWSLITIICSLPYDLLYFLPGNWKFLCLLKVLRIFSLARVYKEVNLYTESPRIFRLTIIVLAALVGVHLVGVSWMVLNPYPELTPTAAYIKSIYWAVTTLTTTGYGDITPTTDVGRIFTMFTMLLGFSAFGIIVGNISNLLMARNRHEEANRQKMEDLSLFMQHYEIPKQLRGEIYNFHTNRSQKRLSEDDGQIIADLPQAIQNELHIFMKIKLINNIPVFQGLSNACLKKVALKLEALAYHAGELIIKNGDRGEEMFIIDHGEVEVVNDQNHPIALLKHGQCFGEIALLMDIDRTASVASKTYCDLYRLKKHDFLTIIRDFPELEANFRKIMNKRVNDRAA